MRRLSLTAAALVLVCAAACRRTPAPVVYDLAELAPVARYEGPRLLVVLGTPAAQAFEGAGTSFAPGDAADDPHVLLRRRADLRLPVAPSGAQVLLLDLAPLPGMAGQSVQVSLDGAPLGTLVLEDARRRYAFPFDSNAGAERVVSLAFERANERHSGELARAAARGYALAVLAPGDPALVDATRAEAPPLLSGARPAVPRLVQGGPSAIEYVLAPSAGARLRVRPRAWSQGGLSGRAHARVVGTGEDGAARELWSGVVQPGSEADVDVALPTPGLVRVRFEVAPDGGAPHPWVVWEAPFASPPPAGPIPLFAEPPPASPPPSPPVVKPAKNVVMIVLDAAGARHFGCYGYARATSPVVDRMAAEGVLFQDVYSPAGFTLLAMGSAWTSQPPDQHHNAIAPNAPLPPAPLTLAELLGARGIHTAGFVANARAGTAFGLERGFAEFEEIYRTHGGRAGSFNAVLPDWVEHHRDRRFFLYLHFREPHFPYDPPPPWDTAFGPEGPVTHDNRKDPRWIEKINGGNLDLDAAGQAQMLSLYDGNLRSVDTVLGDVRALLERQGLWDQTAVIVTADHGEALGEHGVYFGHEEQVYGDVTHIPMVMRLPGVAGGRRVPGLAALEDLAPTIADLLGIDRSGASSFRGRSLLDLLAGGPPRPFVVSRTPQEEPRYVLRHDRWTYHFNTRKGTDELFDVVADPGETRDLAGAQRLRADYERLALHRIVLGLRRNAAAELVEKAVTPEQEENLRALGYVH